MNKSAIYSSLILLTGLLLPRQSYSQVSLAPTSMFIHDQSNVSSLYISNNSKDPQEVTISFEFSYPGSDEEGNMLTVYDDTLRENLRGLKSGIRVFPRQFVLQPGAQQTVRAQVRPMPSRPDGVYWTRIIVSSNAASKDAETVNVTEGISTKINYVFKQNIPAFYLKGKVTTGLIPGQVSTMVEDGKLVAISNLKPEGNSPFNGSVTARLIDNLGKETAVQQQSIVAYTEVFRRLELLLPEAGIPKGTYKLEFTYKTERADIASSDLVQGLPVTLSVPVEIR